MITRKNNVMRELNDNIDLHSVVIDRNYLN